MGFVDEVSGGATQLGPGTLYRTLARLVAVAVRAGPLKRAESA